MDLIIVSTLLQSDVSGIVWSLDIEVPLNIFKVPVVEFLQFCLFHITAMLYMFLVLLCKYQFYAADMCLILTIHFKCCRGT